VTKYPPIPHEATTGLLLFGCAHKGDNDGVHFLKAGLRSHVIDIDPARIEAMRPGYPDEWSFIMADAYRFASDATRRGQRWDVVSVDPFSEDADLVFAGIDSLWKPLARMRLVVGIENKNVSIAQRRGYEIMPRSRGWSWAWA